MRVMVDLSNRGPLQRGGHKGTQIIQNIIITTLHSLNSRLMIRKSSPVIVTSALKSECVGLWWCGSVSCVNIWRWSLYGVYVK